MVAPTLTDFVLAGVPGQDAGAASGVLNTVFQVGSAAGVALAGTLLFALLASRAGLGADALQAAGQQAQRLVFVTAAQRVLWLQLAAFLLGCALVPLLPRKPQVHEPARCTNHKPRSECCGGQQHQAATSGGAPA
jgi:hypothetical protein